MNYYLLDHNNPHAWGGFWGYTSRRSYIRLLVIHTTENAFDTVGPDDGAENVAEFLSRTERQASYHDIFDSDSHVPCLPHSYTAFGARGFNSPAIHMAFAGEASKWHTLTDAQVQARLSRMAVRARVACDEHGIPVRRLFGAAARADGASGICGHADLDPTRRSDPGSGFPWDRFLRLLEEDDMADIPKPDWFTDAMVDDLLEAGVLTSRPTSEPLVIWRSLTFVHRALKAGDGVGEHHHDGRYAAKGHGHDASVRLT